MASEFINNGCRPQLGRIFAWCWNSCHEQEQLEVIVTNDGKIYVIFQYFAMKQCLILISQRMGWTIDQAMPLCSGLVVKFEFLTGYFLAAQPSHSFIYQILVDWRTSSTATWLTPCSPASRSSYFALVPFWAFSLWWWLLGASQSWGFQATSNPTQLTSCPGLPAILQLFQGIAGAWSPWGLCLLLDTPGLLPGFLPFPTYVRGLSISILASTKGQPPGQWPLLKFTMMDQLPEGQHPLAGHLPALMSSFF